MRLNERDPRRCNARKLDCDSFSVSACARGAQQRSIKSMMCMPKLLYGVGLMCTRLSYTLYRTTLSINSINSINYNREYPP